MCTCKHRCLQLQEITTSAAQVFLPDDTRIRTNLITSIYVQPSDPAGSLTYLTPLGKTIATWSVLNSSYLNVVNQNGTKLGQYPIAMLLRTQYDQEPLVVSWLEIDPTQSYVQINTGAAGYNAAHAIVFGFGLACDQCGLTPNNPNDAKRLAENIV